MAFESGFNDSFVTSGVYTISASTPALTASAASGSGGGGGAFDVWFLGFLAFAGLARWRLRQENH
jgi:MYXO-CTERM domain-containing protein